MKFPRHEDLDIDEALYEVRVSIEEEIADILGISSFMVDSCKVDGELAIYVENPENWSERILKTTKMSEIIKHGVLNLINEEALQKYNEGDDS